MSNHFHDLAASLIAQRDVDQQALSALRQSTWSDGKISAVEAEILFGINDVISTDGRLADAEWTKYFVDAACSYLLVGGKVRDYVAAEKADWLVARITRDGKLNTDGELELLTRMLELAINVPETLKQYAIDAIERAVMEGEGPTRRGGDFAPGCITAAEVEYLRRILFAPGSDGPARISKAEAELLFRIKDATLGQPNAPEWETLFVQGVGQYLQGFSGHEQLSEERAAELQGFINNAAVNVGGFLGKMVASIGNFQTSLKWYKEALANPYGNYLDIDEKAEEDAAITSDEQKWLQTNLDADYKIDPLEKALIRFIAAEA